MSDPMFDYESILEACARSDERAFQALYRQEASQMLGLAISLLGQRDPAEDCLHDAFVQIWRNAGRFQRSLGSGRAWIYSILRYRALNQLRQRGRTVALGDDIADHLIDDSPSAAQQHEQQSDKRHLRACLQKLERPRRHPILLAFYRGLTHEQIATRLTTPLGTIKGRIRSGLRALQECLQR
ncbi:RNA polymerase subunit sigma [Pseudomonas daroniae]|uniref:RNA polymerase subunit sigma n=1 Tax=Phytopseudomonas daroniae TaxID=2487519 RepID=A0A4Q9QG91_9GAMM|nr:MULTISPECIES: sigma-70 family RNA polymerase sigma factor [Pseudomonas]TBU71188.1 RNA polymerase subunit sigma [Pseudomonas daroniae]TBU73124.1 RNA polymerase subunit sigma [Pseudomonas sp. FRB 228]TBU74214.1 RNA polymerase subunit sigma [Pseudomonas daroniae]TBU86285.1 RNA polymerase subunit sigma [Pseudomonas daroniae]